MRRAFLTLSITFFAFPVFAAEAAMQVVIDLPGNAERNRTAYQCEGLDEPISVDYINAKPIFLAFVPIEGEQLIFVNVLSDSGARYASGQYEWSVKGPDANLFDLTKSEAEPVLTCNEAAETP